ncbi:DUF1573 domain-containing protein [Flavobacterium sp. MAH-1]|uniref:DUF1573 domain-containing protein n=1 Tax=Flavobacterium agri TaxID=2743471 RepID=A0A7Y8Y319_9FLAO|nr:DUF1573 domain-containing protein [Flavobacterium agri]NUY81655.1 DUF1573 domain-containing protein [Flavobacterium agri]NYA71679.1 DUF1573 domain-containing protein [Flavobacterium agri]
MKKYLLLAMLTIGGLTVSQAQAKKTTAKKATPAAAATPKVEGAGMVFENETIDYGTINKNADGKREFVFVNNGNKPTIITNATGSCGCTVPTKPTEPIQPGAKGVIGVKYATDRVGQFTKTVTVTSNASETPKVLTIKGNVLPEEAPKG